MEVKKTPKADLNKSVGMFTNLGLAVAVGLTLAAFEYKSYDDSALKDLGDAADNFEDILDVPITQQPPPPPPPPPMEQPVIQEIPDEVKIEEKIDVNFDVDVKETTVIAHVTMKGEVTTVHGSRKTKTYRAISASKAIPLLRKPESYQVSML